MCMNCGCGEPNERHKASDITRDDLQKAADGTGMSMDDAASNLQASLDQVRGQASLDKARGSSQGNGSNESKQATSASQ